MYLRVFYCCENTTSQVLFIMYSLKLVGYNSKCIFLFVIISDNWLQERNRSFSATYVFWGDYGCYILVRFFECDPSEQWFICIAWDVRYNLSLRSLRWCQKYRIVRGLANKHLLTSPLPRLVWYCNLCCYPIKNACHWFIHENWRYYINIIIMCTYLLYVYSSVYDSFASCALGLLMYMSYGPTSGSTAAKLPILNTQT